MSTCSKYKAHLIIDFMPLYYKYYFKFSKGKLPKLSYNSKDTSYLYYITKEIERYAKFIGFDREDILVSICFDSKFSIRKDKDTTYKGSRTSSLGEDDYNNIQDLYSLLGEIYDIYRFDGFEADDIIVSLSKYSSIPNIYVISPDKDLIHLVSSNITCIRSSTMSNDLYSITKDNFSKVTELKFDCAIPYNSILLYLCTVGDRSDNVKGIVGFGKVAFKNLVLNNRDYDFTKLTDKYHIIEFLKLNFKDKALDEAIKSLGLVYPLELDFNISYNNSNKEDRYNFFSRYGFRSLCV